MKKNKYQIGDRFIPLGKRKDIHTIVDIHRTFNNSGDEVKMEYVTEHEFMGQSIRSNCVETTVTRGIDQYGVPGLQQSQQISIFNR